MPINQDEDIHLKLENTKTLQFATLAAALGAAGVWLALPEHHAQFLGACLGLGAMGILVYAPAGLMIPFYFTYLMFEGSLKVLLSYHPIVHVGSDLVLIGVFIRLFNRKLRDAGSDALRPDTRARLSVVVRCLLVFWLWVFVQFLNPSALGILPSLAGLKLYVMPALAFFSIAFLLNEHEVERLPYFIFCLGIVQALAALTDWLAGPHLLASLSANYTRAAFDFLKGYPYRPFGTTNLPGAPSIWMFHTFVGALLVRHASTGRGWKIAFFAFLPLCFATLIVCQVRLALIRTVIALVGGLALTGKRAAFHVLLVAAVVSAGWILLAPKASPESIVTKAVLGERLAQAISRVRTLENLTTWKTARSGQWAVDELFRRASVTWYGGGLSRVGAASTPWKSRLLDDKQYGAGFSFADNLYLAIFSELGIGGLLAFLLLSGAIVCQLAGSGHYAGRLAMLHCTVMLLSGYASEGVLYQPDASFFWSYAAIGFRLAAKSAPFASLAVEGREAAIC